MKTKFHGSQSRNLMTLKEIERGDRQNNDNLPQSISSNYLENNFPPENSLAYVMERLELVKENCEDFRNEILWNNFIPRFLIAFDEWLQNNPKPEEIEIISTEFGICLQQINMQIDSRKKQLPLLNKFVLMQKESINYFNSVAVIIDKKSREVMSETSKMPVLRPSPKERTFTSVRGELPDRSIFIRYPSGASGRSQATPVHESWRRV